MHQFFHTTIGFCIWDVAALLVAVGVVVLLIVHIFRQHKREETLKNELSDRMALEALPPQEQEQGGD